MYGNSQNTASAYPIMEQQEFNMRLEGAIQQDLLNNPGKIADQRLAMDRDTYKSSLRINESITKQKIKYKTMKFFLYDDNTCLQIFNGNNVLLHEQVIFSCRFDEIRRYKREGVDEIFWQLILVDSQNKSKIFSPLYSIDILQSVSKLQKTILAKYHKIGEAKINSLAWNWILNGLINALETSNVVELPSKAGWFKMDGNWRFWVNNNGIDKMLLGEQISKFSVDEFSELYAKDLISNLLNFAEDSCRGGHMGELLLVRLCSVFGRLTGELPMELGVAIVGKQSQEIAKTFLRTMQSDDNIDIINLDADRIGKIQNRVLILQDTPVLMVSSYPDSRSTQNRTQRIMGWLQSGYIEGTEVRVPFIFCLRKFSKMYPLDDLILLDADEIEISKENIEILSRCQCFLIQKVQCSGDYFVRAFKRNYVENRAQFQEECKTISLMWAVVDTVLELFEGELDEESYKKLGDFLYSAGNEIYDQLVSDDDGYVLVEIFKKKVKDLADAGSICFWNRNRIPFAQSDNVVFYDAERYFFIKDTLKFVCEQAEIDDKSLLFIKQQLAEQEKLKLYTNKSGHRDLEVDFLTYDMNGEHRRLSGLAIERQFFDEVGKITLVERGCV